MTKSEMTELFAAMMLIYQHDKMFSQGIEGLKPTIEIWTATLQDLDFWTAQAALKVAFQKCKYSPTPADIQEAADEIKRELNAELDAAIAGIRSGTFLYGSLDEYYKHLQPNSPIRIAIDSVGGVVNLTQPVKGGEIWCLDRFEVAYTELLKHGEQALLRNRSAALPARKG